MSKIIGERRHRVHQARAGQIELNILAAKGGRPYVDARLWRAPNESDLSWHGHGYLRLGDDGAVGRKARAAMVNDAGRVVGKITQYLFKDPVKREGSDEAWSADVDGHGTGVDMFWVNASEALTSSQWMWLQADRAAPLADADGKPRNRTLAEKARDRDVIRWTLWPSPSVPDWGIDATGKLRWLITESERYDNADPEIQPTAYKLRTLWRLIDVGVEAVQYSVGEEKTEEIGRSLIPGLDQLPFVLLGTPSDDPWWFDDVENIQAQLLNLDSLHVENLFKAVFPQMVIPESSLNSLEMKLVERAGQNNGESLMMMVREIVRGLDTPMVESAAESGITRFIQPSAGDLKIIPDETDRKRKLLFDMVGLSLFNRETRQIQTAESKAFDHMDTESTLKHRARVMQEAEERLVELSKKVDPLFKEYAPEWPNSFEIPDPTGDAAAITLIANMPDTTPALRKLAMHAALRTLADVGGRDTKLVAQAREEIEAASFDASDASDLLT
jgi:hypothetical protein